MLVRLRALDYDVKLEPRVVSQQTTDGRAFVEYPSDRFDDAKALRSALLEVSRLDMNGRAGVGPLRILLP